MNPYFGSRFLIQEEMQGFSPHNNEIHEVKYHAYIHTYTWFESCEAKLPNLMKLSEERLGKTNQNC